MQTLFELFTALTLFFTPPAVDVPIEQPRAEKIAPSFKAMVAEYYTSHPELSRTGLSQRVLQRALAGYYNLKAQGKITRKEVLTLVDFDQPSTAKRLYVLDVTTGKILLQTYVAHGKNTGGNIAERFSNCPHSLQSSLGFYKVSEKYHGKYGYSLRLDGLEKFNDKARSRAVVMHPAHYVSEDFIRRHGRLGRSFGCPAVPYDVHKKLFPKIQGGSILYIHKSQADYVAQSKLLNPQTALLAALQGSAKQPRKG